jgi:hypothetical protein
MPRKHSHAIADFYPAAILSAVSVAAFGVRLLALTDGWQFKYIWIVLASLLVAITFIALLLFRTPSTLIASIVCVVYLTPLLLSAPIALVAFVLHGPSLDACLVLLEFFVGFTLAAGLLAQIVERNRERDGSIPCDNCGYDLRDIPSGRCPECGTQDHMRRHTRT